MHRYRSYVARGLQMHELAVDLKIAPWIVATRVLDLIWDRANPADAVQPQERPQKRRSNCKRIRKQWVETALAGDELADIPSTTVIGVAPAVVQAEVRVCAMIDSGCVSWAQSVGRTDAERRTRAAAARVRARAYVARPTRSQGCGCGCGQEMSRDEASGLRPVEGLCSARPRARCAVRYGPLVDCIKHRVGLEYEYLLQERLEALGIEYMPEQAQRKGEFGKTPDFLLLTPTEICGHVCNWIESKASFGDPKTLQDNLAGQFHPYLNQLGPGLVIYWFGFIDDGTEPDLETWRAQHGLLVLSDLPDAVVPRPDIPAEHLRNQQDWHSRDPPATPVKR